MSETRNPDDGQHDYGDLVEAVCNRCHQPVPGPVSESSADYVFHRRCAKAVEVYTPPQRRGGLWRR